MSSNDGGRLQRGAEHCASATWWWLVAIPNSHICLDPELFLNETNGLVKGSSIVMVMVEDLVVVEGPPNMRNRSSTLRHGGFAYLADRSAIVRYVGGGGEIARYAGGGDGAGDGAGEYVGKHVDGHVGEHGGEDLDKDLGEDLDEGDGEDLLCLCFWHSSRRCRCS